MRYLIALCGVVVILQIFTLRSVTDSATLYDRVQRERELVFAKQMVLDIDCKLVARDNQLLRAQVMISRYQENVATSHVEQLQRFIEANGLIVPELTNDITPPSPSELNLPPAFPPRSPRVTPTPDVNRDPPNVTKCDTKRGVATYLS